MRIRYGYNIEMICEQDLPLVLAAGAADLRQVGAEVGSTGTAPAEAPASAVAEA